MLQVDLGQVSTIYTYIFYFFVITALENIPQIVGSKRRATELTHFGGVHFGCIDPTVSGTMRYNCL